MEPDHSEIFTGNICKSVDIKLSRRIEDYKILLSTYNDMTDIIEFIMKEQHKIRESLSTGFYRHSDILIKYQEYLENSTGKIDKRRKAIFYLIYSMAIQNSDVPMKRLLDPMEYPKVRKTPFVKSYIDRVVSLEFNKFLSNQLVNFKKEKNELDKSILDNKKDELTELHLKETNSVERYDEKLKPKEDFRIHPFENNRTLQLFNYIVNNWNYNYNQKWADIWNELYYLKGFKAPYKNEYRTYIIKRFNYTGKFQYDKIKSQDNKDRKRLIELIEKYSKK
jgi:hypothetical protein